MNSDLPDSTKTALDNWKVGNEVGSISMGGLGDEYEQVIQFLIFEIADAYRDRLSEVPEEGDYFEDWGLDIVERWSSDLGGPTGAQVAAARDVAWKFLKIGHAETLERAPGNRLIEVERELPDKLTPEDAFRKGMEAAEAHEGYSQAAEE